MLHIPGIGVDTKFQSFIRYTTIPIIKNTYVKTMDNLEMGFYATYSSAT